MWNKPCVNNKAWMSGWGLWWIYQTSDFVRSMTITDKAKIPSPPPPPPPPKAWFLSKMKQQIRTLAWETEYWRQKHEEKNLPAWPVEWLQMNRFENSGWKKKIVDTWSAVALRIWVSVNPEWADCALHIDSFLHPLFLNRFVRSHSAGQAGCCSWINHTMSRADWCVDGHLGGHFWHSLLKLFDN